MLPQRSFIVQQSVPSENRTLLSVVNSHLLSQNSLGYKLWMKFEDDVLGVLPLNYRWTEPIREESNLRIPLKRR